MTIITFVVLFVVSLALALVANNKRSMLLGTASFLFVVGALLALSPVVNWNPIVLIIMAVAMAWAWLRTLNGFYPFAE